MDFTGTGINGHGVTNHPFGDDRRLVTPTRSVQVPKPPRKTEKAKVRRMSDVQSKRIRWLFEPVIAIGKVNLIVGMPGESKSTLTNDIIARVTCGTEWHTGEAILENGPVILANSEDDPEDTTKPRLEAAGADCDLVHLVEGVIETDNTTGSKTEKGFSVVHHLPAIEELLNELPGCKLLIIDPLTNHLGATDSHNESELRPVLMALVEFARKHDIAIVCILHLNKSTTQSSISRVSGSMAFVGVARSVWTVTKDPAERTSGRRLLLPLKSNIATDQGGFAYSLKSSHNGQPFISWEAGRVSTSADEAFGSNDSQRTERECPERSEAVDWLADFLSSGPKPSAEVYKASQKDGFSKRTIERAKTDLGVKASKDGLNGWVMSLPVGTPPDPSEPVADF